MTFEPTVVPGIQSPSGYMISGKRDTGARLPASARAKLEALRACADDLFALLAGPRDRLTDAMRDRQENSAVPRRLVLPRMAGGGGADAEHPDRTKREAHDKELEAEIGKLKSLVDQRSAKWNQAGTLVRSIENYVGALPAATTINEHRGAVAVDLKMNGGDPSDAIERCRRLASRSERDRGCAVSQFAS
jgi:hypothetical protein